MFDSTTSMWTRWALFDEIDPNAEPEREPVFPLPEDLASLSDEQLQEQIERATDLFDEIRGGNIDDQAVADLTQVRDAIRALKAEAGAREQRAREREDELAALDAEIHPADEDPQDPPADPDEDPQDPPADPNPDDDETAPAEGQQQPEPVAAGAGRPGRPPLRSVAANAPRPRTTPRGRQVERTADNFYGLTVTAAADVLGLSAGQEVPSLSRLAEAMHDKAAALKDGQSASLCRIDLGYGPDRTVTAGMDPTDIFKLITGYSGVNAERMDAVVAAGGWCGPLEPLFNLCRLDAADGMLDLPSFRVARGGVSVPSPIVMPSDVTTLSWVWTNADDQAASTPEQISNLALTSNVLTVDTGAAHGLRTGDYVTLYTSTANFQFLNGVRVGPITVTDADTFTAPVTHANVTSAAATGTVQVGKPCIRIPCPTWTDYVLQADGVCVTHGNLADRSFPELTREYLSMVMNAHAHRMNQDRISAIVTGSTSIDGPEISSTFNSMMGAAELAAEFYREKYRMSRNAVLEIVLPQWATVVIRADLAARQGRPVESITDQDIANEYRIRNLRPQFVQDYQQLANATAFPTTISYLIYPAGTWAVGTGGTLDLGVQRDSTLNATNDFTAAWTEEFNLLAKLCAESLNVTSTIAVNGQTGCCP